MKEVLNALKTLKRATVRVLSYFYISDAKYLYQAQSPPVTLTQEIEKNGRTSLM